MSQTKQFPLRVVLSVTTERLLTKPAGSRDNGIGDLYGILNWLTGDNLFTHQLPRANDASKPWVLQCCPELALVNNHLDKLDEMLTESPAHAVESWLNYIRLQVPDLKDSYDIAPLPDGWTTIDPVLELESVVGKERVITVNAPE